MAKFSKVEVAEQHKRLREWLKPGDTVYTILDPFIYLQPHTPYVV